LNNTRKRTTREVVNEVIGTLKGKRMLRENDEYPNLNVGDYVLVSQSGGMDFKGFVFRVNRDLTCDIIDEDDIWNLTDNEGNVSFYASIPFEDIEFISHNNKVAKILTSTTF